MCTTNLFCRQIVLLYSVVADRVSLSGGKGIGSGTVHIQIKRFTWGLIDWVFYRSLCQVEIRVTLVRGQLNRDDIRYPMTLRAPGPGTNDLTPDQLL